MAGSIEHRCADKQSFLDGLQEFITNRCKQEAFGSGRSERLQCKKYDITTAVTNNDEVMRKILLSCSLIQSVHRHLSDCISLRAFGSEG